MFDVGQKGKVIFLFLLIGVSSKGSAVCPSVMLWSSVWLHQDQTASKRSVVSNLNYNLRLKNTHWSSDDSVIHSLSWISTKAEVWMCFMMGAVNTIPLFILSGIENLPFNSHKMQIKISLVSGHTRVPDYPFKRAVVYNVLHRMQLGDLRCWSRDVRRVEPLKQSQRDSGKI